MSSFINIQIHPITGKLEEVSLLTTFSNDDIKNGILHLYNRDITIITQKNEIMIKAKDSYILKYECECIKFNPPS
jgi:hypothetical protein